MKADLGLRLVLTILSLLAPLSGNASTEEEDARLLKAMDEDGGLAFLEALELLENQEALEVAEVPVAPASPVPAALPSAGVTGSTGRRS